MHSIITIWKLKAAQADREIKILISRCDICNNQITEAADNLESQIDTSKDLDDDPRLLLCSLCSKEYNIPSYCPWLRKSDSGVLEGLEVLSDPLQHSLKVFNSLLVILCDMINNKPFLYNSISELESLGLETPKLNELNDSYEVGNLVDNLKQMLFVEYKSMPVFTD